MRVTIHQPEFMPWLGFFHKASLSDVLVLLDDGQFRKNYFHNRNRIRTPEGWSWITVPVAKSPLDTPMNDITVAEGNNPRWKEKIENALRASYGKAPFFADTIDDLSAIINSSSGNLAELNIALIEWLLPRFKLAPRILLASEFALQTTASQRILDICLRTGATTYVSGVSGPDYLDLPSFQHAGVAVELQQFHHPIYDQVFPGFEPQMSSADSVFLLGDQCDRLIQESWPRKVEQVFL
jgi:hypothetical protein